MIQINLLKYLTVCKQMTDVKFPKMNVTARLKYELAYYDSAVHRFNHYTTRTPQPKMINLYK